MSKENESNKTKVNTEMDDEIPLVNPYYVKLGFFVILFSLVILVILLGFGYATNKNHIKNLAPLFAPIMATCIGIIALYYTLIIYPYKIRQAKLENNIREKAKEHIGKITNEIANKISDALIETPDWFDRYMDEIGATFSASIFGKRFRHFYYEKKKIAEHVIGKIYKLDEDENKKVKKYFLIIESGTTMFSLFPEITKLLRNIEIKKYWNEHIYIITNNIPGAQYLMKNCKENPSDDDSKMAIDCFLMPGVVDSNLAATECNNPEYSFKKLINSITNKENIKQDEYRVIGFLTGHHIIPDDCNKKFYPVTSEIKHKEIKELIVEASHEIYLLAPLMQFSFADECVLNNTHKRLEKNKKYEIVKIGDDKELVFFTSKRSGSCEFSAFSTALHTLLGEWYKKGNKQYVETVNFELSEYIKNDPERQLRYEIPDEDLRYLYEKEGINIWSKEWCDAHK